MLIQHARLVDAGGEREGDILIRDGRIAAVGEGHAGFHRPAHTFPHAGL